MATSVNDRLQALAAQYELPEAAPAQLRAILDLVATDPTAPTTVTKQSEGVDVHVADSLTGLELEQLRNATRIADLGAGAGFPGLVLAAALPDAHVHLVESANRKCAFMEQAIEDAGLTNATVVHARAEEWRDGLGACDAVTVRAVGMLNILAEYAAPLLTLGGHFVAYKGRRDPDEERDAAAAATELGLELVEIRPVRPHSGADHRHLYLYSKVTETPSRYPRRAGMARKRPLSTSG